MIQHKIHDNVPDSVCVCCSQCYDGVCCAFQAPHSGEEWLARKGGVTLCEFRWRCRKILKERMPRTMRHRMWEVLKVIEEKETNAWWLKFVDLDEVHQVNVQLLVEVMSKLLLVVGSP